ncbi:MAG: hypothetical protein ABIH89_05270 [Elusimicrobiota bacterium]
MDNKWILKIGDKSYGPVETGKVKLLIEKGKIPETALIAEASTKVFKKIFESGEFKEFLKLKFHDKIYGPFSSNTIVKLIKAKKIDSSALIAQPLRPDRWFQISTVNAFKSLFAEVKESERCPKCGAPNSAGAVFCSLCKSSLIEEPEEMKLSLENEKVKSSPPAKPAVMPLKPADELPQPSLSNQQPAAPARGGIGFAPDPAPVSPKPSSQAVPATKTPEEKEHEPPPFHHVTLGKFILFMIITLGIYEIVWFYKQWKYVKNTTEPNIKPFWRMVFSIFYCHNLFKRVQNYAMRYRVSYSDPGLLAVIFIIASGSFTISDSLRHIPVLGLVPYLPILGLLPLFLTQKAINEIKETIEAKANNMPMKTSRLTQKNIMVTVMIIVIMATGLHTADFFAGAPKKTGRPDVSLSDMKYVELDNINMSIRSPGEFTLEPATETGETDVQSVNYMYAADNIEIRISYTEYTGEQVEIDAAYGHLMNWISSREGVSNLVHNYEYADVNDNDAISFMAGYSMNNRPVMARGLIISDEFKIWTVAVFVSAIDQKAAAAAHKIVESVSVY